ncbi:PREDICTED: uncharacterized protein LOC109189661 [Ipomoea nil]|uniref:uncharacterized protein LOC109189661 n=1 Tax=Ipomoea nil TaxID=35883 RepID=UPI0009012E3B|nr:PREDICTED: uncharacterized protein LOC109189661 [Ipomoea nil]
MRPPTDHSASLLRTPFTAEIMAQPYPLGLRIPGNKEYDGRTDPEVHVNTYYGNMMMMGVLEAKFMRKFVTSKVIRKPYMYLEKAKQLEGKSLTEFLVKWKAAVGEVESMDDLTAIHMFHISLRAGYLYQDFIFHPPTTYEEALRRVIDYANASEANAVKRSQEVGTSSRKSSGLADHRSIEDHSRPRTRPGEFTALNRSAAEAMQYAQSCNLIRLPQPGPDGPDKSKHCAYHRCAGHDTEECTHLKQLLEDLLTLGKLDKCVGKREENKRVGERKDQRRSHHRSDRRDQDRRDLDPPSSGRLASKPTIHVIFGGLEDASRPRESCPVAIVDSRETGKRQKMEPITYTLEDQPKSGDHGMEALVVAIDIMGTDVQRVMVDTGSSVNVLYLDVFEKLKLDKRELIQVGVPLSGFTGATIRPEGMIVLLVEIGTPPKSVKTELEFVVVNLHCVHNVILGRPAIMRVGGIISILHLCMKFPTPAGVEVVRGDVQSARKCYTRAVN